MSDLKKRIARESRNIPHIIPAYKIIEQVSGASYIEDYVNEILPVIEDDIKLAIENPDKRNFSITEIQTVFDIPNMSNSRAQMYVYFHLLRALKKSEYFPRIRIENNNSTHQKVFIYVKWFSKEDIELEHYMNEYIQAHTLNKSKKYLDINNVNSEPNAIKRRRRIVH